MTLTKLSAFHKPVPECICQHGSMRARVGHAGIWIPWPEGGDFNDGPSLALGTFKAMDVELTHRLVVLNQKGQDEQHPILQRFGGPSRTVTPRTRNAVPGRFTAVIAAWPTKDTLDVAVSAATGGTLAVLDWGQDSNEGWATATRAFNARSGEQVPALNSELVTVFDHLLFHDREMSMGRTTREGRTIVQPALRELKAAGLDFNFIGSYCIASGYHASGLNRLQEHYKAA